VEGNDCFINEMEVLNQIPFVWPLADSKNRSITGLEQLIISPCFFKEFMISKRPRLPSGLRGYCFWCGNSE
jgi:hypothetical protein